MPKVHKRKSVYKEEVVALQKHAEALRLLYQPNIKSYATTHNLPYQRLRRAYLGLPNRCDRAKPPALYRLNESQDLALERYLDAIDNIGFGIHRGLVEQQANSLLEDAYTGLNEVAPKVGKLWARRWLARHPKYRRVKAKSIEVQRKLA